jgi:hypothetical protein
MSECTIVILAAGIGSRYGGLKQADPVGPHGELIIHYSVYDAMRAGFGKVVFVIRREIEEIFLREWGTPSNARSMFHVFQNCKIFRWLRRPCGRKKPPGDRHAVLCCKMQCNFAVLNLTTSMVQPPSKPSLNFFECSPRHRDRQLRHGGVALSNTLSEHGTLRGVCCGTYTWTGAQRRISADN